MTDIAEIRPWIGRRETLEDVAAPAPLNGLAALLDHETPPWEKNAVPPLGHWLYFLPRARQSEIDADGRPKQGEFLPPTDLPRRVLAGGTLTFHAPIPTVTLLRRETTITDVSAQREGNAPVVVVKLRHEIFVQNTLAVSEDQEILHREAVTVPFDAVKPDAPRSAEQVRRVVPDPTLLVRFSALMFDAHRIHYDRDYACETEYYPGLVVQTPLVAILLMDHLLRVKPAARIRSFSYRARSMLFDTAPFELCLAPNENGYELWARDTIGREAMTAEAVV